MEEFERSKKAEARAEGESGPAFYTFDSKGIPHFGMSKEDAARQARAANEGYQ